MSWIHCLLPVPEGSAFSEAFLRSARDFWSARPAYTRSDGTIVVCRDTAYRDAVVREKSQDRDRFHATQGIVLRPERIELHAMGIAQINRLFAEFIEWAVASGQCRFVDESWRDSTAARFLESQRPLEPPSN